MGTTSKNKSRRWGDGEVERRGNRWRVRWGHVPSSGVRRVIRVDQAACFFGAGLSAFGSGSSSSSRVMVM